MFKICHNHIYLSQEPSNLPSQLLPVSLTNISNALSFEAPITPSVELKLIGWDHELFWQNVTHAGKIYGREEKPMPFIVWDSYVNRYSIALT